MKRVLISGIISVLLCGIYAIATYRINIPFYLNMLGGATFFFLTYVLIGGLFKE